MKKNLLFKGLAGLLLAALIVNIGSCSDNDDNATTNTTPTCSITSPSFGDEIMQGETITISVEAEDEDNNLKEVHLYIDGTGVSSSYSFPYNYEWETVDASEGSHTIKAVALDEEQAEAEDEVEVTVVNGGEVPVAAFSADSTSVEVGTSIQFTDESTGDPTEWQWDFGDGNTSTEGNPMHTYSSEGTYDVELMVSNEEGSDSESKTNYITVNAVGEAPVAVFTANQTSIEEGGTIEFADQSLNNPTSWSWDFGDGNASTEQNPAHSYSSEGNYTVELTVENGYGSDTETKTNYIEVSSGGGGTTGSFTDPRDGQTYETIEIGNKVWFAENLNYETDNSWWYDNDPDNGETYGRLYIWESALNACPEGWHLPSDDEWKTLEMELGMSQSEADDEGWRGTDQGEQMKSTSGWNNNGNGTNTSGFSALPGGDRRSDGSFDGFDHDGHWWSATEISGSKVWSRHLDYVFNRVGRYYYYKTWGISVRCLKD